MARRYVEKVMQPVNSRQRTAEIDTHQDIQRESNRGFTMEVQKETGRQERETELSRLREQKQESRTIGHSEVKPQEHPRQKAAVVQIESDRLNREQISTFENVESTPFQSKEVSLEGGGFYIYFYCY